jgi:hypothetical protein
MDKYAGTALAWLLISSGIFFSCSSSDESAGGRADSNAARPSADESLTDLAPAAAGAVKLDLVQAESGLVLDVVRNGVSTRLACGTTCQSVCEGCLNEACSASASRLVCNAAASDCSARCDVCMGSTSAASCEQPSCAGDLSCYFGTVGVPEEYREIARDPDAFRQATPEAAQEAYARLHEDGAASTSSSDRGDSSDTK